MEKEAGQAPEDGELRNNETIGQVCCKPGTRMETSAGAGIELLFQQPVLNFSASSAAALLAQGRPLGAPVQRRRSTAPQVFTCAPLACRVRQPRGRACLSGRVRTRHSWAVRSL